MTQPQQLLKAAQELLVRAGTRTGGAWSRAAALLTRQVVEASLRGLWTHHSPKLARCPARIQLLCLEAVGMDAGLAGHVRHAWGGLSDACHHHPYEVSASAPELLAWIQVAARLDEFVRSF